MNEERMDALSSESVSAGHRTYFFDMYESESGAKYLRITESKSVGGSSFERRDIIVWLEHIPVFFQGLAKSISTRDTKGRIAQIKKTHPRAYQKWTETEEEDVKKSYSEGKTVAEIARVLKRQPGAITSRLEKLGLK